jgi:hypothetical protein
MKEDLGGCCDDEPMLCLDDLMVLSDELWFNPSAKRRWTREIGLFLLSCAFFVEFLWV